MRRRTVLLATLAGVIVLTLTVTGHRPDVARSLDLLAGRAVTTQTQSAVVALLCWLAALTMAVTATLGAVREREPGRRGAAAVRCLAVFLVGIALLGAGLARQDGYRVCCATPTTGREAQQLVR